MILGEKMKSSTLNDNINIRNLSNISYVKGLDGIRAIAVLLVIFHHLAPFLALSKFGVFGKILILIAKLGWVGVDIFFVISGYLIAEVLTKRPITSLSKYKTFVIARAWRLLPAYLVCLIVFSLFAIFFTPDSKVLSNSLSLWTLTTNFQSSFIDRAGLIDSHFNLVHFWSLALEWHFYLMFPILIYLLRGNSFAAIFIIILALLTRIVFQTIGTSDNAIYCFTLCRLDGFGMGILLSILSRRHLPVAKDIIGILGLGALIILMLTIGYDHTQYKKIMWLQSFGYTFIPLAIAMSLLPIVSDESKMLVKYLEKPLLLSIGQKSYSLYIWHLVFAPSLVLLIGSINLDPITSDILIFLFALVVTFIAGNLSYKFVELKFYLLHRSKNKV